MSVKVQRWLSPRFLGMTLVSTAWKVLSAAITIVGSIFKSVVGRSAKSDMRRVRKQQASTLAV